MAIAKIHTDRLKELKETVEKSKQYFNENEERFKKFMKFVFKTSMSDDERSALASTGKPTLEFNICEAILSKQRGEFSKQEPKISVRSADGIPIGALTPQLVETINVVEDHMQLILSDAQNDMFGYNIYTDTTGGGYSVARVFTQYINEKSFEQNIFIERVFDPTLTGFDPLARKSHKGDGRYCFEIYPMTKDLFEDEFGSDALKDVKFTRNVSGFSWSFKNEQEEILLVCDFYEKKTRKETIYKLTNGHSITKKEYEKFIIEWEKSGYIEQPPAVIKERKTVLEYICRYRFCEGAILDYVETDFKYLPLVFFDGNSVIINEGGAFTQMTRSSLYHAEGIQRLKNYSGQCLANELENSIQHRFIASIEGIPVGYEEAYQNVQKPDTLLFNQFHKGDTSVPLMPPQVIARTPIPPEITNTFNSCDALIQGIIGNYDNSSGISSGAVSGVAIARSAIQSNNASVPYIVGYIKGLNRVAEIIVDLIPKYYRTPRSLPTLSSDGKKTFKEINQPGSIYMNYDPNHLEVKVEAGVNFAMQKEIALQTVIAMSQANEGFAKFFNDEGLSVILDNIDIRGIDQLKEKASEWMQQQKQMQQQQMKMAQQQQQMVSQEQQMKMAAMQKEIQSPTEGQVGMMMVQQKSQTDAANLSIKARDSETKFLETISKIRNADVQNELKAAEINAEQERTQVESALKISQHINETLNHQESANG